MGIPKVFPVFTRRYSQYSQDSRGGVSLVASILDFLCFFFKFCLDYTVLLHFNWILSYKMSRKNGGSGGMSKHRRGVQECFVNPNSKCTYIFPGSCTGINCINPPVFTEYYRINVFTRKYLHLFVFTEYYRIPASVFTVVCIHSNFCQYFQDLACFVLTVNCMVFTVDLSSFGLEFSAGWEGQDLS